MNIDLNSFDEDDKPVFQERVSGRDATRRAMYAGSSGSSDKGKSKVSDSYVDLSSKLDGLMSISKECLGMGKENIEMEKVKQKTKENAIKLADVKVLTADYSHLKEPERMIMFNMQREIREKYGYS